MNEELIGFLDLGDPDTNFSTLDSEKNKLATHALVFFYVVWLLT